MSDHWTLPDPRWYVRRYGKTVGRWVLGLTFQIPLLPVFVLLIWLIAKFGWPDLNWVMYR
ncbi:MAG: hypothetical protein AMS18_10325 [Gemmatimonas sp. SG8_17]|nr:MAG: hypothetical protein AMS18_10325 [Gemmatimonas sp. SG8_17]